ncbi:hypothetical protein FRC10_002612 [Ceratobasidium sp. 414]|nr:hypothetical protein FRC10_002612 [Ceratobasidium sp. 414]
MCSRLKADITVKVDAPSQSASPSQRSIVLRTHPPQCSNTPGCDYATILANVVVLTEDFVDKVEAQVDLWIEILILKVCVGLTVALCAHLATVLAAYIQLCLDLCANIVLMAVSLLKIKLLAWAPPNCVRSPDLIVPHTRGYLHRRVSASASSSCSASSGCSGREEEPIREG